MELDTHPLQGELKTEKGFSLCFIEPGYTPLDFPIQSDDPAESAVADGGLLERDPIG